MKNNRFAAIALAAAALVCVGIIAAPAPSAEAACGGVSYPRIEYWCNTVAPNTAYYSGNGSYKYYNEIFEGGGLPVGIYWQIPGGSAWGAYNANGYAYHTYPASTTDLAVCWNRTWSTYSSAACQMVLG